MCLFTGDFIGGSLFSAKSEGLGMTEVCNEIGLNYVTLGNHEFDFGETKTAQLMDKSNFKWLGSNV
jgi:5'-nucleotidase